MTALVDLCSKSSSTWSASPSCYILLNSRTKSMLFTCSSFSFVSQSSRDLLYSINLNADTSFCPWVSSNSLCRSRILVTCTTSVFTSPRTLPGERSPVSPASDYNGKRSLFSTILSTFLRPDTCNTITDLPCDRCQAYATLHMQPLLPQLGLTCFWLAMRTLSTKNGSRAFPDFYLFFTEFKLQPD